jgi:tetratricopeptide (TPR) repeat protein
MIRRPKSHPDSETARFPFGSFALSLAGVVAYCLLVSLVACGEAPRTPADEGRAVSTEARTVLPPPVSVPPESSSKAPDATPTALRTDVTYEEAEAAWRDRRYDEATELFVAYTRRRPDNPWGQYMLGLSAWKAGEPDRAIGAFEAALALDSTHVKSLVNLSRVRLETGDAEAARSSIERALVLDPESGDAWRVAGNVRSDLGQVDEAIEAYRRALAIDDGDAWAMNNLGLALIRDGRYEQALGPLARAVELQPGTAVFQNNLGVALECTDRFGGAIAAYRAAVEAEGGSAKAEASLARLEGTERAEDPIAVDLGALASAFQAELDAGRIDSAASAPGVPATEPEVEATLDTGGD